jgi:hypothetical protein
MSRAEWQGASSFLSAADGVRQERFELTQASRMAQIASEPRPARGSIRTTARQSPILAVVRESAPVPGAASVSAEPRWTLIDEASHRFGTIRVLTRRGLYRIRGCCSCGWQSRAGITREGAITAWRRHLGPA